MSSFIEEFIINRIEAEKKAERWEMAATALMAFIQHHVRIVGHEEINAYHTAKEVYERAENGS